MKYRNELRRRCNNEPGISASNNVTSRQTFKSNDKWQVVYDRRRKKYKLAVKQVSPDHYVFYSVLNTDVVMEMGIAASTIARSIIALHNKLAADRAKNIYIDQWQKSGENIIVLRGYGHKHLRYLEREAEFAALGKHAIYHRWHHNRVMLALSVFGRKAEIEDIFDGLPYLR